jgi:hypothetical protein
MCLKPLGCLQLKTQVVEVPGTAGPTGPPGSQWLHGNGVPDPSLGVNGDYYAEDDSSPVNVYTKTAGAWAVVFTLPAGPTGPAGPAGADGAAGFVMLLKGAGITATAAGEVNLMGFGYSIPVNTLPTNYQLVRFVGNIQVVNASGVSGANPIKFLLKLNGSDVSQRPTPVPTNAQISGIGNNTTIDVSFIVEIIRKSATEAQVNVTFKTNGNTDTYFNCADVTGLDWTALTSMIPYCNITNAVGGLSVTLKNYRIEKFI